jgi:hypothetical protein
VPLRQQQDTGKKQRSLHLEHSHGRLDIQASCPAGEQRVSLQLVRGMLHLPTSTASSSGLWHHHSTQGQAVTASGVASYTHSSNKPSVGEWYIMLVQSLQQRSRAVCLARGRAAEQRHQQ